MKVAIIDYGSGNLRSAAKSFERAAELDGLGAQIIVTGDADVVATADRIVLPGVGAFKDCKAGLDSVDGLHDVLTDVVMNKARPFFGICVGMQLMADVGHEFGDMPGLGWVSGDVVALNPNDPSLKIPHMGWNNLQLVGDHALFEGIPTDAHAYFVHSYQFIPKRAEDVWAQVEYGGLVTAAVGHGNVFGTQFHPEKSQSVGLKIISNFLKWKP